MIDLTKLEKKFDELFATETVEFFELWLTQKRQKQTECQIKQFLGAGHIEEITEVLYSQFINPQTLNSVEVDTQNTSNSPRYAMAA